MNIADIIRHNFVTAENGFKGTAVEVRFESLVQDLRTALDEHTQEVVSRTWQMASHHVSSLVLSAKGGACCVEAVRRVAASIRDKAKENG